MLLLYKLMMRSPLTGGALNIPMKGARSYYYYYYYYYNDSNTRMQYIITFITYYISLHSIVLHYIKLHYVMLYYIILYNIMLHYII